VTKDNNYRAGKKKSEGGKKPISKIHDLLCDCNGGNGTRSPTKSRGGSSKKKGGEEREGRAKREKTPGAEKQAGIGEVLEEGTRLGPPKNLTDDRKIDEL